MTVPAVLSRVQYNGNGVTTSFTFASRILDATHLKVVTLDTTDPLADPAGVTKTYPTDYNVTGVGDDSCSVVFVVAPATGILVTILRDVPLTQSADYTTNDPFPAQTHENALDKLTMIAQQQEDELTRSAKLPETADTSLVVVLPVAPEAGKALIWGPDNDGTIINGPTADDLSVAIAACNADVVLTHADVVLTHADVVLTHADVVLTHADVIAAAASAAAAAAAVGGVKITTSDTTPSVLNTKLLVGLGLKKTTGSPGGNETLTVDYDINSLTEDTDPDYDNDFFISYDASATAQKKVHPRRIQSVVPQNSQSAAYTTVLADAGKHIYHPSADTTARIFTIDSNANVAYKIGTTITFVNDTSAGVVTIAITSDTLLWAGAGTTGSRSLAAGGLATALKITATKWIISGSGLT